MKMFKVIVSKLEYVVDLFLYFLNFLLCACIIHERRKTNILGGEWVKAEGSHTHTW